MWSATEWARIISYSHHSTAEHGTLKSSSMPSFLFLSQSGESKWDKYTPTISSSFIVACLQETVMQLFLVVGLKKKVTTWGIFNRQVMFHHVIEAWRGLRGWLLVFTGVSCWGSKGSYFERVGGSELSKNRHIHPKGLKSTSQVINRFWRLTSGKLHHLFLT